MDRFGEWRPIDPAADDDGARPSSNSAPAKPATAAEPARPEANVIGVRLIGLLGSAGLAILGITLALASAPPGSGVELSSSATFPAANPSPTAPIAAAASPGETEIVVDVEGAVARPGLHRLPAGSRIGDAVASAGGYSAAVDIAAAATTLNLAQVLEDGSKVHVPARGGTVATVPSAVPFGPSAIGPVDAADPSGALININTASAEQLESLPGIGEVTAAKIIAAREETPFASVEDLQGREVLGPSTFEKVRDLVTVGP